MNLRGWLVACVVLVLGFVLGWSARAKTDSRFTVLGAVAFDHKTGQLCEPGTKTDGWVPCRELAKE